MKAKKLLIPFVLASLTGHALVIALTTGFDRTGGTRPESVLTVDLQAIPENPSLPEPPPHKEIPPVIGDNGREDSALLDRKSGRYDSYLRMIRRKVEAQWRNPPQAQPEKGEGTTIVRFTIAADGALKGMRVTTASGSPALDQGTLAAIRAAAPYAPLPSHFKLSRLHITATFNHR